MAYENFDASKGLPPNKYIIAKGGRIYVGRNWLHKNFLKSHPEDIKSGGWWYLDQKNDRMYFYSRSEDFGAPTLEEFTVSILDGGDMGRFDSFDIYFTTTQKFSDALEDAVLVRKKLK